MEAEKIIHKTIESFGKEEICGSLEMYIEEKQALINKIKEALGEKYFIIPNTFAVKSCKDGISLTIKPVNVDNMEMRHVYDIDWKYPITKYAFILYKYALDEQGKIYIDIEGKRDLPVYDFQNSSQYESYFLLLYRLMKLEKCYPWIVLSDTIEKNVRIFEQNLIQMKTMSDSFLRLADKQPFRNPIRPSSYYEMIVEKINDSGKLTEILERISKVDSEYEAAKNINRTDNECDMPEREDAAWSDGDIKQKFPVNLYRGECKKHKRLFLEEPLDFYAEDKNVLYGIMLYRNVYDSIIEKVFFYANYLGDLLEDGLFENAGQMNEDLHTIKEALCIVLMTQNQESMLFKAWMEYSQNVVKKVRIIKQTIE